MKDYDFRYKNLYYITYILYFISFFIPAYAGSSASFSGGETEIWFGWKCALIVSALIFTKNFLLGIFWSIPNFVMIAMLFIAKPIRRSLALLILLLNVSSCFYWWIQALDLNNIGSLLPGYWLWLVSITGNNVILLTGKRIQEQSGLSASGE
jgi:hypothetical protein